MGTKALLSIRKGDNALVSQIKSKVFLHKQDDYDVSQLLDIMSHALVEVGVDLKSFDGKRVALKPNLITGVSPESGIVTDPAFFEAAVKLVKKYKGTPVLLESPAFMPLDRVLKKTGYDEVVEREGLEIADTRDVVDIENPNARKFRYFTVAKGFMEADYILNLPKLKTHGLTYYTGAVKNLFGLIHGLSKSKWHIKAPSADQFVIFLIDFYEALMLHKKNQFIHIVDGIRGLEGEGPGTSGRAKIANVVIAGTDGAAVDSVSVRTVSLDYKRLRTSMEAQDRGLGCYDMESVQILGESLESFTAVFDPPVTKSGMTRWPFNSRFVKNLLVEKPVPHGDKCTLCYQCKKICPAGAIDKKHGDKKIPSYDYDKCIRCYCCMEVCPEAAISLRKGIIQKLLRY